MQFHLYLVDSYEEKFYDEAKKEYERRLSRYCKLKIIKVKDFRRLEKKIKKETLLYRVIPGKPTFSSEALAEWIQRKELQGLSKISFLIGASQEEGFFEGLTENCISISPMFFSEGLLSTVLLEQIYRAYRIIKNEPYHK